MTTRFVVVPGHASSMAEVVRQLREIRENSSWKHIEELANNSNFDVDCALSKCEHTAVPENRYAQPLQFLLGYACYLSEPTDLQSIQGVAGHSLGEFLAAAIAGSISWNDGLRLVTRCGTVMDATHRVRPGAMSALLGFSENEVSQLCSLGTRKSSDSLGIANINRADQIVVSGDLHCLNDMERHIKTAPGKRVVRLGIRGSAHSSIYEGRDPMNPILKTVSIKAPAIPLFLSTVSSPVNEASQVREALAGILVNQVNWVRTMHSFHQTVPGVSPRMLFHDRGMSSLLKPLPQIATS
ncbi:ACP S-malonyltransferase [Glutamicibacter endophyticus]|uniref:ACP S-malonyltransferase n=1 Tax=Glutamicibacter endophyticus TaxID=1522174 RepID=UPI003AF04E8E